MTQLSCLNMGIDIVYIGNLVGYIIYDLNEYKCICSSAVQIK